ncbi:hypothetical protein BH20ACT1_BH20ACT1_04210 [soil metagenome]
MRATGTLHARRARGLFARAEGGADIGWYYHSREQRLGVSRSGTPFVVTGVALIVAAFLLPVVTTGALQEVVSAFAVGGAYLVFAWLNRSWLLALLGGLVAAIPAAALASGMAHPGRWWRPRPASPSSSPAWWPGAASCTPSDGAMVNTTSDRDPTHDPVGDPVQGLVRHPLQRLDDTVHQRVRLGILAVLAEADRADFTYLPRVLDLTDAS